MQHMHEVHFLIFKILSILCLWITNLQVGIISNEVFALIYMSIQMCKDEIFTKSWEVFWCQTYTENIDVCETLMPPFPNITFDLDLWPTDLKINRDHLNIKDYLPIKFEASGAKRSWVISCTRLRETDIPTDGPTDGPTCATQYAPPF